MTVFNFHIGLPRIGKDILQSVALGPRLATSVDRYIVAPKQYREDFRGLINRGRTQRGQDEEMQRKAKAIIRSLAAFPSVALSQHALLGTLDETILSPKFLERAAARVTRLSDLFGKQELKIHLTVMNQVDYVCRTMGRRAVEILRSGEVPSWFTLVSKLHAAAPDRQFVVWDFDWPNEIAPAFVISMLNLTDENMIAEARALIRLGLATKSSDADLIGLHALTVQLDECYDEDLTAIETMAGVSLIRANTVSKALQI